MELWLATVHVPGRAAAMASRAERDGFDGISFGDTPGAAADPYVGLALAAAATSTIRLGVRVTTPAHRPPAGTAAAIATVQMESGGRAVLGVGRGESSLRGAAPSPAPLARLATYVEAVQGHLGAPGPVDDVTGGDIGGRPAGVPRPLRWLPAGLPKVPVDVAATGPRAIALGARLADTVTLNVGADPARVTEAVAIARRSPRPESAGPLPLGAYVNVVAHPDTAAAQYLVKGPAAAYAHYSRMGGASTPGAHSDDEAVFAALAEHYDRRSHGRTEASHTRFLTEGFLSRFAVAGPPELCVERLSALVRCGLDRLVIVGPAQDGPRDDVVTASRLLVAEVLPALRAT